MASTARSSGCSGRWDEAGNLKMDSSDQTPSARDADADVEPQRGTDAMALWIALAADRLARDERTARLRAMRLIAGEDDGA